jgi:3-methylcrotonyl-CoA carboxylase alpha subunit
VADQLRIAAGEALDVSPGTDAIDATGHAVEVRLYAEDAENGFLPAIGRIEALRWPAGEGIRVDAGIDRGSVIGGRFDPMLAKIIAWGPDRPAAFERLTRALDATVVLGVVTNLRFLRWLVRQPVVLAGEARTDVLERIWPPDDWAERVGIPDEAWQVAAGLLLADRGASDPWADGWRMNARRSVRLEADGDTRLVELAGASPPPATSPAAPPATSPATSAAAMFDAIRTGEDAYLDLAGRSTVFRIAPPPDVDAAARAAVAHGVAGTTGPADLVAPMPGAVLAVHVTVGDAVEAGDPVVTLEAMKMEHVVAASIAGRVGELLVRPSDQVTRGQRLAIIEP